jgi:hypothetical protein
VPGLALQDFISWEEIDNHHAKAELEYEDIEVSGIFTFNDNAEMVQFTTDDRIMVDPDGQAKKMSWSVRCGDYINKDGIRQPSHFQAIWHYPEGDYIYFDCSQIDLMYKFEK